jgi:hypothetical protein
MRKLLVFLLMLVSVATASGSERTTDAVLAGSGSADGRAVAVTEDSLLTKQLNDLETVLTYNERKAGQWWKSWTALYGVATVGQGIVAGISDQKSTRQDMILGAGTTALGVLSQVITPVSSGYRAVGPDSMAKMSVSAKQKRLEQEVAYLKKQADLAAAGKSWQTHALSGAVNLASGLITWVGFKRSFGEGLFNFALNTVVTETQIWTQPVRARKEYQKMLRDLQNEGFRPSTDRTPEWYSQAGPGGFCLGLRF